MLILTIRTDKPLAELGLYDGPTQLGAEAWEAHRALAETIHTKIEELLVKHQQTLERLEGIVVFKGPGSFTGLRIGVTVANALAQSLKVPIIASDGETWTQNGIDRLAHHENDGLALPEYGALPNITPPKK